jgi:alpha-L-fucosidase
MTMRHIAMILAGLLALPATAVSRAAPPQVSWLPAETAAQRDTRMAWWRQAKFGMFIHWGIYSIPADGEWHMRNHKMPFAEYSKFAAQFNPVKFNADEWMGLAHDAGMKYVVITTKHHDGFAMFKSEASRYNVVDATPFKRDVVKELSEACPRHDIRFGTYYSFLADWGHKGGGAGCPHWDPAFQDGDLHDYIKNVALAQLKEILTNYHPSVVWFDTDGASGITPEESAQVVKLLQTDPQVIVDPRLPGVKGDFSTPEQQMPATPPKGDWELCGTVNGSWGYTHAKAKPLDKLLPYMITAWGMGGNVLMNVGPTSEGIIPEDSSQRLRQVGQWLKTYGESIYGTTAGPFGYLPWGTATRKGDTIYLQIFQWPADGHLGVPLSNTIKTAKLLGPERSDDVKISQDNGRSILDLPATAPDPVANVVAITVDGEPQDTYRSVLLDCQVKASAAEKSAAGIVAGKGTWKNPETTGWLEFDAGKPVAVAKLRLSPSRCTIKNYALEYKDGDQWKPILSHEKATGDNVVKDFPPVTAQQFRLNILEADKPAQIANLELYPPL